MKRSMSEMQTVLAMGVGMMAAIPMRTPQRRRISRCIPLPPHPREPPHLRSEAIGERSSKRRRQRRRGAGGNK